MQKQQLSGKRHQVTCALFAQFLHIPWNHLYSINCSSFYLKYVQVVNQKKELLGIILSE